MSDLHSEVDKLAKLTEAEAAASAYISSGSGHSVSLPTGYTTTITTAGATSPNLDSTVVKIDTELPTEEMLIQLKSELEDRKSKLEIKLNDLADQYEEAENTITNLIEKIVDLEKAIGALTHA